VPEIVGNTVLTGGELMAAVFSLVAGTLPAVLVAVTTTRIVCPRSAAAAV
jgi:hypothetical protein